ncbi:hypothetical protein [Arthrobacter sp. H14]|uniref:hypothetical protein n=1 Tax=Arthrobacter sp. H14 TaxID=1312959 RepID=UPI00047CB4E1|nr:hypothetical protein [Arthrobacter sp. H14]
MTRKTGWCLGAQDCDTETGRGGCPVQTGQNPPCDCTCHDGATAGRGMLADRKISPRDRAREADPAAYA